jgi:hypothetical protein
MMQRKADRRIVRVPFGDSKYSNYQDKKTGLNLYKSTNDKEKRKLYRARHNLKDLRQGFYSPGHFRLSTCSYYILW